jgi:lipopolysaccharide export system permease protein
MVRFISDDYTVRIGVVAFVRRFAHSQSMIFDKALRRDLSSLAGVVFATLFTITVTTTLIRMLGRAAGGRVDVGSLLPLIAFASIKLLPVLLVLALYVSVLMALSRAFRDSEMVVWFASGRSLLDWIRPILRFALPLVLVITVIGFELAPWANRQIGEYTRRFEQREDVSRISAGQFSESASGSRVFFVESLDEDQTAVSNVFVTQQKADRLTIVVAAAGHVLTKPDGERFLVLEKGRRYDGDQSASGFKIMEFASYALRLQPAAGSARDLSAKDRSTLELIESRTPQDLGELAWRIGLPVSALLLVLLAIPLSSFNPRVGRSVNLAVALLVYVLYSNLVSLAQAWIAQGRVPFAFGVWVVHAIVMLVVVWLFWRRLTLFRFGFSVAGLGAALGIGRGTR